MSPFTASRTQLMALPNNEFVIARYSGSTFQLFSFTADYTTLSVTRNWTSVSVLPTGFFSAVYANGVISFIHTPIVAPAYYYGEIALTPTSFTLSAPSTMLGGVYGSVTQYVSIHSISSFGFVALAGGSGGHFDSVFKFVRGQNASTLAAITGDILKRAGYVTSEFDVSALANVIVSGYTVPDATPARSALEPLQAFYPFDLVENDGVLQAKAYGDVADVTIDASETRASITDSVPARSVLTRAQELDLPSVVTVDYLDPALDYQKGSQRATRGAGFARMTEQLHMPLVCDATAAKRVAQSHLYRRWTEREKIEAPFSRRYMALTPGDVVAFDGRNVRVTQVAQTGGLLRITAVPVSAYAVTSDSAGNSGHASIPAASAILDTVLYIMDLPCLRSADDQPGFYAAAGGTQGWRGAGLYRSGDNVSFTSVSRFTLPAASGMAASVLADGAPEYMDRVHTVNVAMLSGTLSSCSELELLNGANAALLGGEIVQFQNATLNSDGSYTLLNLLRGRRGTQNATSTHRQGEAFVLLQDSTVKFLPLAVSDRGRSMIYRAASLNQDVSAVGSQTFAPQLKTLQPLAPVYLKAARTGGGDATLSWLRCARLNTEWQDYIDVPLDEDAELYDIEIMSGLTVVRTFSGVATPSQLYTAAQQTSDFGSVPASLDVRVYQLSSRYGRGAVGEAIV